jgi:hypothetical protein
MKEKQSVDLVCKHWTSYQGTWGQLSEGGNGMEGVHQQNNKEFMADYQKGNCLLGL